MNVVYTVDDNGIWQTCVSLTSLFENNKEVKEISIYILNDGLCDTSVSNVDAIVNRYNRKIYYINVQERLQEIIDLGVRKMLGITYMCYAKMLVGSCLPPTLTECLYLDSDVIVCKDISNYYNTIYEIDDNKSFIVSKSLANKQYRSKLGLNSDQFCFNPGVMLINLDNWRNNKCEEKLFHHMKYVRSDYPIVDEDILCATLPDQSVFIGPEYNYFPFIGDLRFWQLNFMYGFKKGDYYTMELCKQEAPFFIHYINLVGKPWDKSSIVPMREIWNKYMMMTVYKDKMGTIPKYVRSKRIGITIYRYSKSLYAIIFGTKRWINERKTKTI